MNPVTVYYNPALSRNLSVLHLLGHFPLASLSISQGRAGMADFGACGFSGIGQ